MKILNVKGVQTISKSQQQSISGGNIALYMCWLDCMKVMAGTQGTYEDNSKLCEKRCS